MSQFDRMIDIESNRVAKDASGCYPYLERGQVVHVKFVGQGTVLDGPHYAIIWDAFPTNEHVVVLPLTSKSREGKNQYDLGNVFGLVGNSVVKANQPQSISRKNLTTLYLMNPSDTATLLDRNFQPIPVLLQPEQLTQVTDLYRISQFKEPTFYEVVSKKIGPNILPVDIPKHILAMTRRPVTYFIDGNRKLYYRFFDDEQTHVIDLIPVSLTPGEQRRRLRELLSEDDHVRERANQVTKQQILQTTV